MRILITAGPTREPLDAVRFISNRSSGKIGLALATAAAQAGHAATLLLGPGPTTTELPAACHVHRFESTAELQQLLDAHFRECDLLIMAAAVADYRPATVAEGKLPRDPRQGLTLHLEATPDLVAAVAKIRRPGQHIIAFALEEKAHLAERALAKMQRKGADAIVANPLGTMEAQGITATLLWTDGTRQEPGRMSKLDFARWLLAQAAERFPPEA